MRLRDVGSTFYELLPNDRINFSPSLQKCVQLNHYLNQLFGYPLGQILAQQCGITSEGLDVTSDPTVAAFFAIFDFRSGQFVEKGSGVIYRFNVKSEISKNLNLNVSTFYNCPSYLDAETVLSNIKQCDSWETAAKSFLEYNTAYQYALDKGESAERPLEVLTLPTQDVALSRVVQQRAGLLFPDMILSQVYRILGKQPPSGKAEKIGENAVEDLSSREGATEFLFKHSLRSKFIVPHSPQIVFPEHDPLLTMLKYFLGRAGVKYVLPTELGVLSDPGGFDMVS
jgi:hypothetical protein